jgi:hypothetical protein
MRTLLSYLCDYDKKTRVRLTNLKNRYLQRDGTLYDSELYINDFVDNEARCVKSLGYMLRDCVDLRYKSNYGDSTDLPF